VHARKQASMHPSTPPHYRSCPLGLVRGCVQKYTGSLQRTHTVRSPPSGRLLIPPSIPLSLSLSVCLSVCLSPLFSPSRRFCHFELLKRCTPAKQRQPPSSPLHPALLLSSVYSVYGRNIPIYHVARVHESSVGTHAS